MTTSDFSTTLSVDQTSEEVFNAITNLRGWWSEEIEGSTDKLNEEFKYHFEDLHRCRLQTVELLRNKKIVWLVLDNYFKFTKDTSEWTGTKISIEVSEQGGKTKLRFSHVGLVSDYECFEMCSNAWTEYIQQSLRSLITTGRGNPNGTGKPTTEDEEKLSLQK